MAIGCIAEGGIVFGKITAPRIVAATVAYQKTPGYGMVIKIPYKKALYTGVEAHVDEDAKIGVVVVGLAESPCLCGFLPGTLHIHFRLPLRLVTVVARREPCRYQETQKDGIFQVRHGRMVGNVLFNLLVKNRDYKNDIRQTG